MDGRQPTYYYLKKIGKKKKRKKNLVCWDTIGHAPEPKLPKEYDKTTQHVQLVRLTRSFWNTPFVSLELQQSSPHQSQKTPFHNLFWKILM
jgi:hypothetical protein